MTKFFDVFEPIQKGDYKLTDEAIYKSIQSGGEFIPIWGGNQDHSIPDRYVSEDGRTNANKPITIFEGEGIIISLDGSAGNMTYKKDERFALNHHAGFLKVRNGAEKLIIPEFFALFYQKQLQEISVSEGSKTLSLEQIYSMDFNIPLYDVQKNIMGKVKPLLEEKKKLQEAIIKIDELFTKQIVGV